MTPKRIAERREMLAKATPGPWESGVDPGLSGYDHGMRAVAKVGDWMVWIEKGRVSELRCKGRDNATLIAAAPTALAEALDEVERLQETLRLVAASLCDRGGCFDLEWCLLRDRHPELFEATGV